MKNFITKDGIDAKLFLSITVVFHFRYQKVSQYGAFFKVLLAKVVFLISCSFRIKRNLGLFIRPDYLNSRS